MQWRAACSRHGNMFWNNERHSTIKGLAAGAIGGAVASLAMNQFQAGMSKLFEHPQQDPGKKQRAREAQGWKEHGNADQQQAGEDERANTKVAVAISQKVFDRELAPEEKEWAGEAVHYGFGTVVGALYGVAAEEWDGVRSGEGTAFGAALWLASDEVAVPIFKLSRGPQEYPLRTHAMALASHLVYGFTTEIVRRALRVGVLSK